jgi:quercetin dioxygenase-like cupin family protein
MADIDRRHLLQGSLGLGVAASMLESFTAELSAAQRNPQGDGAPPGVRRIITANNAKGRSYVLSDEVVQAGGTFPNMFKTTGDNLGPGASDELKKILKTDSPNLEPAKGGCNLTYVQLPPNKPGSKPFWHITETLDFNILLSGELELLLDEGKVTLRPFSVVIQRNTNHAWVNTSSTEPVRWVAILLPASTV